MIIDLSYKFLRKILPAKFYSYIKSSKLGREQQYYVLDTFKEIYYYYKKFGLNVNGNVICELGAGSQFYTAFFMLLDGAEKVILADPVFQKDVNSTLKEQLEIFNKVVNPSMSINTTKIKCYSYLDKLDNKWNNRIDFICSHFVLEHFKNLEFFFSEIKRLLKPDGISINRVDLSDHTYHILVKYPFLFKYVDGKDIDYYKYSERIFNLVNDPKCYMNRIPLPVYLNLVQKYNLKIEKLESRTNQKAARPHRDVLKKYSIEYSELLQTVDFTISLKNI
jgi:SAM-dependent methyltransferase